MLLPAFLASASPVMVQEIHQHINTVKITASSSADILSPSDAPVYCKVRYRKSPVHKATTQKASFPVSDTDPSLLFPFLCDRPTRTLLQRSKVLFVMRGLPGSGKSTVVKAITAVYPHSVVCSADDHFLQNGAYTFDAARLGSAHAACQRKAEEACEAGVSVVVVDNTNVRRWEMKFYLALASRQDYVVVPVTPKTAWRWIPEELAVRNKHSVDVETLQRKVKQFDDVIPLYYAWFLPEAASKQLTFIAQCLLGECVHKFPAFTGRLLKLLPVSVADCQQLQLPEGSGASDLFKRYYTRGNKSGTMLHCTAKFCGGGRAVGAKAYHALPLVQNSVGQCFLLHVHSLCFSPRTVGARVQLTEQQLPLFSKPEEQDWNGVQPPTSSGSGAGAGKSAAEDRSSPQRSGKHCKGSKKAARSEHKGSVPSDDRQLLSSAMKGLEPRSTKPVAKGSGRSAHITVACAQGVESRETNFDVLRLCDMEAGSRAADADFVPVTGGRARCLDDGVCCVYFDPLLCVKTIYSGFF